LQVVVYLAVLIGGFGLSKWFAPAPSRVRAPIAAAD
jgi:hypothetical protein